MQLARELDQMQASYDAVVVGSGYGAGVAASRLARMGFSVAVLERGREFAIGEFPDTLPEATQEFQYVFNGRHEGKRTGLFELHYGRDMHVLVGCGLGGTSLINANVALPPDPRVWEDPRWPTELFDDDTLEEGFARARRMLRPVPYPNERPPLDKLTRLGEAATALGAELSRPPITVAFQAGPNAAAVVQPACNLCGDCCSGCNVGAKTTVQMTYLPDAANHGAEIFTGATVRHVKKEADGWRVLYTPTSARRDGFRSPERSIAAKIVVLGAGALGSTEILLRSRAEGLAVSDRLGQAFTGNGDVLAFAYNGDKAVNAVGVGVPARTDIAPPGPCITGAIDLRASSSLEEGMIIEEGVLPSGLAEILPATFSVGRIFGKDTDHDPIDELQETARRATSALLGTWRGAMHNTATFLVMAHDGSAGRLEMDDDGRIRVDWPGISKEPVFARVGDALRNASAANGATYVRNPMQNTFLGKNVITVHPLGGCGMGRDTSQGVVDHACRVYDASPGAGPDAVHDGLYVCDGAAIPRSLGVNPLLTITALAERAMMHVAKSSGRDLSDAPKADAPVRTLPAAATRPATGLGALVRKIGFHDLTRMAADSIATLKGAGKSAAPPPTPGSGRSAAGVEFTERMTGYLSDKPGIDYVEAVATGKAAGSDFSFTVAVRIADIDAFIRDSAHGGTLSGTAICPALSPDPLDISNGVFRLMRKSDEQVETRLFEYLMTLTARDGRSFEFKGIKYVHDDRRADLVADTTTLFIDLAEAGGTGSAARGILRIKPLDFARQVRTIKAVGGASHIERASAVAKFGALFAGQLFDIYGDIFAPVRRFDPARARKKRGLRAGEPEVHGFTTADGKRLRLTRYKGGTKGPLLFSHGLGVSSLIFRIDTIDTNLLEFMYEQGYDCWLLDFRASIDLPYARDTWTADDCAREDYQPAVDLIRRETGAPSIQVLAHCFGATTFVMSMLGGHLTGVRSAVISQIAADVIVPFYPQRLLAYLRLPAVFDVLGIPAVNARATVNDGLVNRIADGLMRVAVPFQREERSRNATSNRIAALYGQLYETDQLNALTFETGLPEMFGDANIDAFKQLALIARGQTIVDAAGNDAYMPHLERLAIPISFIHGGENACFLPESTARTLAKLSARNGAHLYDRHVIPNYGHIDCIFGKSAVVDVYPKMLRHLEETAVLAR